MSPVLHTPVVNSPLLAQWIGAKEVFLKDDSCQSDGSFKVRGAMNFLAWHIRRGLNPSQTAAVAASHGNHAQGVVMAANHFGFKETLLVMPLAPETQLTKIRNCLRQGAIVFLYGSHFAASSDKAQAIADHGLEEIPRHTIFLQASTAGEDIADAVGARIPVILYGNPDDPRSQDSDRQVVRAKVQDFSQSMLLVPTYNDVRTAMGQGTDALDLLCQKPELLAGLFTYVVAVGGGGKLAGDATVLNRFNPETRIFGVNSTLVPVLHRSLQKGFLDIHPAEFAQAERDNRAEGTGVPNPGIITFDQIQKLKAVVMLVTSDEIDEALVFADTEPWYDGTSKRIEGATAAALAALLGGAIPNVTGERVVLSITGKNIDRATMDKVRASKWWVAQHPDFYRMICSVRRELRQAGEPGNAGLTALNKKLCSGNSLNKMIQSRGLWPRIRLLR